MPRAKDPEAMVFPSVIVVKYYCSSFSSSLKHLSLEQESCGLVLFE